MTGNAHQRRIRARAAKRAQMPVSPLTLGENGKDEESIPLKEIAPPEPANEAEGGFRQEIESMAEAFAKRMEEPPKKRRGIWNWLRKLVTKIKSR